MVQSCERFPRHIHLIRHGVVWVSHRTRVVPLRDVVRMRQSCSRSDSSTGRPLNASNSTFFLGGRHSYYSSRARVISIHPIILSGWLGSLPIRTPTMAVNPTLTSTATTTRESSLSTAFPTTPTRATSRSSHPSSSATTTTSATTATMTTKGILQPYPKYPPTSISIPPSRRGNKNIRRRRVRVRSTTKEEEEEEDNHLQNRHHQDNDDQIPEGYRETIIQGFGENVDLYRDVLQISPAADARVLRISYFRRGRQILADAAAEQQHHGRGQDDPTAALSEEAQTQFQAVSMAYDILSNPIWNEIYRQEGLCRPSRKVMRTTSSKKPR
jgi:hypothetical protein